MALADREERGEELSLDEQRLLDGYWARFAKPLTDEQRQRFIAAARRGMEERNRRVMEWRCLLFTVHWWLTGREPTWHDYFDCSKCHRWPAVKWTGPYDLGQDNEPRGSGE